MLRAATASRTACRFPTSSPQHSRGASARACATTASSARRTIAIPDVKFRIPNSEFLQRLHNHRNPHPAADAQRCDSVPELPRTQGINQCRQDPRAAGANRMTERDGAAIHVDLRRVEAELAHDRERLDGERLVQFKQIDVPGSEAGPLERLA